MVVTDEFWKNVAMNQDAKAKMKRDAVYREMWWQAACAALSGAARIGYRDRCTEDGVTTTSEAEWAAHHADALMTEFKKRFNKE